MFIGTLGAINQNKIKRLLAYSSIAHVGYLLISLATGTIESIEALLIYTVLYMLTIINIFSIILVMARENFNINETRDECPPSVSYQPTLKYLDGTTETYNASENKKSFLAPLLTNNNKTATDMRMLETDEGDAESAILKDNTIVPHLPNNLCFSSSKIKLLQNPYKKFKLRYASLIQGNPS